MYTDPFRVKNGLWPLRCLQIWNFLSLHPKLTTPYILHSELKHHELTHHELVHPDSMDPSTWILDSHTELTHPELTNSERENKIPLRSLAIFPVSLSTLREAGNMTIGSTF